MEQIDDHVTGFTYNTINELVSQHAAGAMVFEGTVNEPASVTVAGRPAMVSPTNAFRGTAPATAGTTTVTIVATDASGNAATRQYDVPNSAAAKTFTYDANGNLTSDGTRTFEWNARNQLVAINQGTHRSEFSFDGENRRVRIVEKESATVVSDERFVWDRNEIVERRDASGSTVTARVYRHGLQENGATRNLTRDHVLSIREVTDGASVQARYEYAPFGAVMKVAGSTPDFFGFTGVLLHEPSDLFLMKRRAYDTALGRWLSEDPLGIHDGPNLYAYVANDPLRWIDPDGTVAMELPWQQNGNVGNWYEQQDNVCSQPMGFLGFNGIPCIKKCCQAHDACYAGARCNWTSWLTIQYESACTRCNRTAVLCILNADTRPDACNACEQK